MWEGGRVKYPPTVIRVEKWGSIAVLSSEFDVIFQISFSIAVQNAEIPPNFLVWKFCGSTQRVLGGSPEILQKLRFQTISTPGNLSENTVFYAMHRVLQSEWFCTDPSRIPIPSSNRNRGTIPSRYAVRSTSCNILKLGRWDANLSAHVCS